MYSYTYKVIDKNIHNKTNKYTSKNKPTNINPHITTYVNPNTYKTPTIIHLKQNTHQEQTVTLISIYLFVHDKVQKHTNTPKN